MKDLITYFKQFSVSVKNLKLSQDVTQQPKLHVIEGAKIAENLYRKSLFPNFQKDIL